MYCRCNAARCRNHDPLIALPRRYALELEAITRAAELVTVIEQLPIARLDLARAGHDDLFERTKRLVQRARAECAVEDGQED